MKVELEEATLAILFAKINIERTFMRCKILNVLLDIEVDMNSLFINAAVAKLQQPLAIFYHLSRRTLIC